MIWQVSPTIRNCTISNNNNGKGAGFYIVGKRFRGAVETSDQVLPVFINCTVKSNTAAGRGGGGALDLGGKAVFIDYSFRVRNMGFSHFDHIGIYLRQLSNKTDLKLPERD